MKLPMIGTCQCGKCSYSVTSEPFVAYTCHCIACQQLSSSAFNTCMQLPAESVEMVDGSPAVRERVADSGNGLKTWFCPGCGSALFSQNTVRPRIRTVYVGALENAGTVKVNAHIWVKRKLPWVMLPVGHRVFEGPADWSEDYAHDIERYKPPTSLP